MMHQRTLEADLERLAKACRILALDGHNDLDLGHLSLRDPAGRALGHQRMGIGLDEVGGAADFVLIDFDANRLAGPDELSATSWRVCRDPL